MATFYFLTDTKEYSTDGINWHTCENARFSRYPDSVIFINDFSSIPIYPATDVVNIDGGVTGNPYTPAALVAALKTVFPKASTTSVSDGSVDLSNYFTRTQSDGRYELVAPASFTDNLTSYKQASTTIYNILDKYTGQYITATEQTTGVDDTMVDNIIYWKISNKYYKRNYSYVIDAKIFGVKADGVTDDTVALQKAIDFCLSNGKAVKLVLPKGAIIISSTLNFGNSSAIDANQASFCVEGQGMNSVSSATGGGTAIKYTGADNTISLFNLRQSFGRYGYFSRFSLMAGSADGANVGINFETSTFSFFRFDEIEIADFKTAVKLNIGGGVNGEFTEWHRCRFTRFSQYGYYHDAPQALSQKFINCNFTPKAGAIVWNYVAVSGGQFIGKDRKSVV